MVPLSKLLQISVVLAVTLGQQLALAQQTGSNGEELEDRPPPKATVLPPRNDYWPMGPEFHQERRMRTGLLVPGLMIGGGMYVSGILAGAADGYANAKGFLFVPVFGPWITLATRHSPNCGDANAEQSGSCRAAQSAPTLLFLDGMGQLAGGILVTLAFTAPAKRWVPHIASSIAITPVIQGDTKAAILTGAF